VKVWIYKGDITNKELAREQAAQKSSRPERRDGGRGRGPRAEQPATAGAEA
jgi:small subunit ribosomal protein S3